MMASMKRVVAWAWGIWGALEGLVLAGVVKLDQWVCLL